MNTNEAITAILRASGKNKKQVSLALGRSPAWLSSTLSRPGSSEATTVAAIAGVCGYSLALVPPADLPGSAITIDPPEQA